jgi:PAS domain S-box-containing protein
MAYHDQPHTFSRGELDLGLTIARQLGFAIERERARDYRRQAQNLQNKSDAEFRVLADNIHQLAWMANATGWIYWYNQRWFDYTGTALEEMQGFGWKQVHHPDHVERVLASYTRAVEAGQPWEDTFPLRGKDGEYRWFLSRALPIRDDDGQVVRWFGTNTDITERLQAEEQRTLLINELNHRVKNTLATVQSLAMQTLREDVQNKEALALFNSRLAALSRAHDILTHENWKGAQLRQIVDQSVAPFRTTDRIDVGGPDARVTPKQALALSIALHELGTNAMKYGALSDQGGRITLAWSVDHGALHMSWRESGGPPVTPPTRSGFGTRLIERSLSNDLGGEARILYLPAGVVAQMSTPLEVRE